MIGIFDSGSGGLTVFKEIRARLPKADIIYFGDIKNAPYGIKSHDELVALTANAIALLQSRGARNIVSACNSVSAALAVSTPVEHLIEMVEPTVNSFRDFTGRILLTATPATISSNIYQNAFQLIGKEISTVAIPDLAGAIEFGRSDEEIEKIIRDAFQDVDLASFDALILGCTHYPLVKEIFERVLGAITIIDPAVAVAERVENQMGQDKTGAGTTHFVISKDSTSFRDRVASLPSRGNVLIEVLD